MKVKGERVYHEQKILVFIHHLLEFGEEELGFGLEFVLILVHFIRRWIKVVVDVVTNQSLAGIALVLERRPK